ncbi:hypothetical protein PISMIDRAFT_112006, partial [Pisolithus microcarpus 441]
KGVSDPGKYDGSISRFEEWWSKMKAYWQLANFATTSQDCLAVWTQLEGPVAGAYARARIDSCRASTMYPDMVALEAEIKAKFRPINNKDWAKAQLQKICQGSMHTEEFMAKFGVLAMLAGASDDYTIFMLEQAMCPDILQQIFIQGRRKATLAKYIAELRAVGGALEAAHMHTSSRFMFPSSSSHPSPSVGTFGGSGIPMEIGAASTSWPPNRLKLRKTLNYNSCRACHLKMQAFFYNKQINEMKAQGKGFGQ